MGDKKGRMRKPPLGHHMEAAGFATKKVPVIQPSCTVGDAERCIRNNIKSFDALDYVYVVDKGKLTGVFSIRRLYQHHAKTKIESICRVPEMIKIGPEDNAVLAAYLSLKHGISMIPVVSDDGTFMGAIPKDRILSILHKKHVEDRFFRAGIHRRHAAFEDTMNTSILSSVRYRILWLFVGLLGGILAAGIVGHFEEMLSRNLIIATFIPLVVYISDAVGTQLEAFTIRDFVLHHRLRFLKYFLRQSLVVFIISAILGACASAIVLALYGTPGVAAVIGISVMAAILSSMFTGLLFPFIFRTLKKDPAAGSGPLATIAQDIVSVSILFITASMLL
jgi:magnesium transporter